MNKILTIVIPTYNMEDYLSKCLDSLVVDSELMEQLEVLVVNDGSKDNSSVIAHGYDSKYPATFRVIDKENGNYGSCVNRGLAEAKGKYIKILDADDWFDTNAFKRFLCLLEEATADMILTPYNIIESVTGKPSLAYYPTLKEGKTYLFSDCSIDEIGVWCMHAVTYRVEKLRSISYVQSEGISYTDIEWVYNPLYAIKTMCFYNCNVYQYLMGREGQTMDPAVMIKAVHSHEIIAQTIIDNELINRPEGFARFAIERQICFLLKKVYRTRLVLQDSTLFDDEMMKQFDNYILAVRPDLYYQMGHLLLKPYVPIPYVAYWRFFGQRFPVDYIKRVYRKLRYGKQTN